MDNNFFKLNGDDEGGWFPIDMAICIEEDEENEVSEKADELITDLTDNLG
jgi:hypothetical protein